MVYAAGSYPATWRRRFAERPGATAFSPLVRKIEGCALDPASRATYGAGPVGSKLIQALFYAYFEASACLSGPKPVLHPAVARVETLLGSHSHEPLDLDAMADRAGVTPAHLVRESGLSAAEIADRCGFANPQHFSKAFKQRWGRTPRQLRRESWSGSGH
jgi:AraC-like DNA-binding protein